MEWKWKNVKFVSVEVKKCETEGGKRMSKNENIRWKHIVKKEGGKRMWKNENTGWKQFVKQKCEKIRRKKMKTYVENRTWKKNVKKEGGKRRTKNVKK